MLAPLLLPTLWRTTPAACTPSPPESAPVAILAPARAVLAKAERLLTSLPPAPRGKLLVLPTRSSPPPPSDEEKSAWDPEDGAREALAELDFSDKELLQQTVNGCKALLLEIIRRASYDWVLYRTSRRMMQRVLADQAYKWLFLEGPGTADWEHRRRDGKDVTSFVSICEGLDLDPDIVRKHIKRLTPKNVTSIGRPAEYRRRDVFSSNSNDDVYSTPGMLMPSDDAPSDDPSGY
jgi:hypothetical protein